MTPQWLTEVLCADHPGARVEGVEVLRPSRGSSTRCGLVLTYNAAGTAAGLPVHVFAKGSSSLKTRLLLGLPNLMASEVAFYNTVRPELRLETPASYHASHDDRSWRHCILLEDIVATRGARFCTPVEPITRAEAEQMVVLLASFHAPYWNSPRFGGDLRWLTGRTAKSFVRDLTLMVDLEQIATRGAERFSELLPSAIVRRRDELRPALVASLEHCGNETQTLMHGDSHLGQFYRTADGQMGIFDWQTCGAGGWSFDVGYTLSAALTISDRRSWERDLLELYVDTLGELGADAPTVAHAFEAYRRALVYPLVAWLFALNRSKLQPVMQPPDTCRALVERIGAAVDDLDVLDELRA